MAKHRVYEVARNFDVSSNALLQILSQMGVPVKGHMSTVDDDIIERVRQKFEEEKEAARKQIEKKIRRVPDEPPPSSEPPRRRRRRKKRTPDGQKTGADSKQSQTKKDKPADQSQSTPETTKPKKQTKPQVDVGGEKQASKSTEESSKPEKTRRRRRRRRKPRDNEDVSVVTTTEESDEKKEKKDKGKEKQEQQAAKAKKEKEEERKIEQAVKQTLAQETTQKRRKYRRKTQQEDEIVEKEQQRQMIRMSESLAAIDLARMLSVDITELIQQMKDDLGLRITRNQRLDVETVTMIADDFGFDVERVEDLSTEIKEEVSENIEEGEPRPPVVTIMGHVDHGKTSLLDYIRHSQITSTESGGITQHIGAYEVILSDGSLTFLDTPGHEAFTAMRARGATATDIVILVVAADDGVMPQTVEAIDHAKAAGVPIIVAINKTDLPTANSEWVKTQLSERGLIPEEWGGETIMMEISARTGENIDKLLEMVLLQAEMMELKADPNRGAVGVVIESRLEPGRGTIVSALIQQGKLQIRDCFVSGLYHGRVRAMTNDRGEDVEMAGPSQPVVVLGGLSGLPNAGDSFVVVPSEKKAREIADQRQQLKRQQEFKDRQKSHMSLTDFYSSLKKGETKTLKMVIKADVDGSVEALSDALLRLNTDEVELEILHKGVGLLTENDVMLASASDAIIIGFHVDTEPKVYDLIKREGLDFRRYEVIYEVIDDVKAAMEGLLEPDLEERAMGVAQVRAVFNIPRSGSIAGCYVLEGTIRRDGKARLRRGDETIYEGKIDSLKRFKDDVREVQTGYECGIGLADYNNIQEGDHIEVYEIVEITRKLSPSKA